ncbi:MAG: hypothetical protein AB7L90_07180 [Hyphomicrobiaceae bacterium]
MRSEGYRDLVKCSLEIELAGGKVLRGVLERPRSKSLAVYMNADDTFLELHLYDGSAVQVAKAGIVTCRERTSGNTDTLGATVKAGDLDNPLTVLGIAVAESREQVRRAYLARMRLYHSDRYGGVELPPEVQSHMETMTKRLNVAYHDALAMCGSEAPDARSAANHQANP